MMCSSKNSRRGFTLVEILVAMAIFALGGTAILALFITNAAPWTAPARPRSPATCARCS
jgi:prepilin-type N-terminal cleavage/methylation domain-containing protein